MAFFACVSSAIAAVEPSAVTALEPATVEADGWVLQLGYFARLENALNLKQRLSEAGFEAQVVSTGQPGAQRYLVISGRADSASGLLELQQELAERTGSESFPAPNPLQTGRSRAVFDAPAARYLLAQADTEMPLNPSPMPKIGYDSGLSRTPQQAIDSMPGFTAGRVPMVPTIGLSLGYDDNITRASHDEIASWFYLVSPAVRAELPGDRSVLSLTAAADIVRYQDSARDDRTIWYLRGDWVWDISTRQNLQLFAQYSDGADARGEGRRQGNAGLIPLDPDEWQRLAVGGLWDYGAVGARGRLTLRAGASRLEYTNYREGVAPGDPGTAALDRDWWYYGGTFYWRIAPKSSLLADYQHAEMRYTESPQSDSDIDTWMLGITWDASARTTGRISYGDQKRRFADPEKEGYSGPAWLAAVSWRPRTYSVFTLAGSRNSREPDGNGDYVLRQDITLSWVHDWATRFGSHVDLGYGRDQYRPAERRDSLRYWGVGVRYTYNPHLRFGASVRGYDRNSNDPEYEYRRLVYLLTLEASL